MAGTTGQLSASATFPGEPMSVRAARAFVCEQLAAAGYEELRDAAAIAATELVTNAILHARTDYSVRVAELPDRRVRISVRDGSTVAPVLQAPAPGVAVGRGLGLVAEITNAWGVQRLHESQPSGPGKEVWFELGVPNKAAGEDATEPTYDPSLDDLLTVTAPTSALVDVRLLGLPLQLFSRETQRHRELMREMALISFSGAAPSHVPAALTALAAELEMYRGVGAATDAVRDAATERGDAVIDLDYRLPPAVGPACRRLNELLDSAEDYCRSENLLTLAPPPEGTALRRWYLSEIGGQIDGAPPTPWTGPLN